MIASEISGRDIRHVTLSDDEYRARKLAAGTPPHFIDFALGMFVAARRNEFAAIDPTLTRLVGHAPTTMRTLLTR